MLLRPAHLRVRGFQRRGQPFSGGGPYPCQRVRLYSGFEIVEANPDYVLYENRTSPFINNCGEMVFSVHAGPTPPGDAAQVFHYDNGVVTQLTFLPGFASNPDINDHGNMVWDSGGDGFGNGGIRTLKGGQLIPLGSGVLPSVNNLDHVAWQRNAEGCFGQTIILHDGNEERVIFVDPELLSNQSVRLNDGDELTWTRYDFCTGGAWTSRIMRYAAGGAEPLPSVQSTPQVPNNDNLGRVAWGSGQLVEVWQDGTTIGLTPGGTPALSDSGDLTLFVGAPKAVWLVHAARA